jgi:hypothetical protein
MEAGNELISRSGMGVITLGERIQRLKAQGENAATTLAQNLVPALNTLTDALIDSGGKTGGIVKQFSRLFGAIIIGAAAAVDVLSHMNTLVRAMNDDVNARNISAIGDAYRRFAEQARAAGNIEEARRYFTLAQQQYQRSADLQRGIYENTSLRSIQQRARSAIAELNRLAAGTDLATGATQRHTDAQRETAAAVHNTSREVASLQSKYAEFLRGDNNISFLNEADYDVAAAKLEEEYERLSDARDASGNLLFSEEQRMRLWETYLQRGQTLLERTNYFVAGSLTGIQSATQRRFQASIRPISN